MKPEDQIKALAELDGFESIVFVGIDGQNDWRATHDKFRPEGSTGLWQGKIPTYLTSYDAIIPLIQKQDIIIGKHMLQIMHRMVSGSGDHHVKDFYLFLLTPAQLAEALLRATGKWKE